MSWVQVPSPAPPNGILGGVGRVHSRTAIIIGIVSSVAVFATDPSSSDLEARHLDAYVALVQADAAREKGNLEEARRHYRSALERYEAISRLKPDWRRAVVQYRIAYCRSRLEALSGKPLSGSDPSSPSNAVPAEERLVELEAENAALRAKLESLERECAALRASDEVRTAGLTNLSVTADAGLLHSDLGRLRELAGAMEDLERRLEAAHREATEKLIRSGEK